MSASQQLLIGGGGGGGASESDPYFASVVLLLHGEGTNGSTTVVDSSSYGHTVTCNGSAQISTMQALFGTASLKGGSGNYFSVSLGTEGSMTGDFTVEIAARDGNNSVVMMASGAGYLYNNFFQSYGGPSLAIQTNASAGAWHRYAISRVGSTIYGFLDGTLSDSQTYSGTVDLQTLNFGRFIPNNNLYWAGYWDEIRITKGVGRYTANYSLATAAFPDG